MLKAKLRIVRAADTDYSDDIISIYDTEDSENSYRITYRPGDMGIPSQYEFYLTGACTIGYISSILRSLPRDLDPFHEIQVTTPLQPSILYAVEDLRFSSTRELIQDAICVAMACPVDRMTE